MPERPPFDRLPLLLAVPLLVLAAAQGRAEVKVSLRSDSILRYFEQEKPGGDKVKGIPGYEYLRVDGGSLEGDGFSFHGFGWGRHDFGDYYDDKNEGELLVAYAQYSLAATNLSVRLGRQYTFDGVANQSFDGARLATDLTPYVSVSAYGGLPVSVEEVNGRSGDRTWGGRVANRFGGLYEVGASYKRVDDDGGKQTESLGIDSSLTPPGPVSLFGYSTRNLIDDAWAEHSYEARLALPSFLLRPSYHRFDYDAFFDTGRVTGRPFSDPTGGFLPFKDSGETVTAIGAEASWAPPQALELSAKAKHYDYKEASQTSWYYGALAAWHGKGAPEVGLEAGRMDGDAAADRYKLGRAYVYWDVSTYSFSADVIYVTYDEDINGQGSSLFASLGASSRFLSDALTLKVSGDYSKDPYFDKDYRGTVAVSYVFDR